MQKSGSSLGKGGHAPYFVRQGDRHLKLAKDHRAGIRTVPRSLCAFVLSQFGAFPRHNKAERDASFRIFSETGCGRGFSSETKQREETGEVVTNEVDTPTPFP